MASGLKISQLTSGTALSGPELFPSVQVGANVSTTATQIKTWTSSSPTLVTPNIGVATGTSLALGSAGSSLGTLYLAGSTSGTVTIQPQVSAGTWTWTVPSSAGSSGQYLQTNGSGVTTWATVPTTTPGGSTTQVQFNNAGAFDGSANFTWASGTLTVAGTNVQPLQLTPTWAGGDTYTALQISLTDTLSNVASKVFDASVGGVSKFSVRKDGKTVIAGVLDVRNEAYSYRTEIDATSGSYTRALEIYHEWNNGSTYTPIYVSASSSGSGYDHNSLLCSLTGPDGFAFWVRPFGQIKSDGTTDTYSATTTAWPFWWMKVTWLGGGTQYGLLLDVTDTSSAAASLPFQLKVGGVEKASISKTGVITGTSVSAGTHLFTGATSGTVTVQPAAVAGTWSLTLPTAAGTSGYFLQTNGSGVTTWAAAAGTPAGSNTQVQFNNSGAFGASSNLVWTGSDLTVTGTVTASGIVKGSGLQVPAGGQVMPSTAGTIDFGSQATSLMRATTSNYTWFISAANELFLQANRLSVKRDTQFGFCSTQDATATVDTGIARNAAGVLEVNNGTSVNYRDIKVRDIFINGATYLSRTTAALTNSAAAQTATMTNGPTAGNPTKWVAIDDNGTTRYLPLW